MYKAKQVLDGTLNSPFAAWDVLKQPNVKFKFYTEHRLSSNYSCGNSMSCVSPTIVRTRRTYPSHNNTKAHSIVIHIWMLSIDANA